VLLFAATLYGTLPLEVPLVAPVKVIHVALLAADHAHPVPAVTLTLPVAALAVSDRLVGVIAYVHAAPACVTVNVCPAMVSVPVRWAVPVFAATL